MKKLISLCVIVSMLLWTSSAAAAQGRNSAAVSELERYLNNTYDSVQTPMGVQKLSFEIVENEYTYLPYDCWIKTEWEGVSPVDIAYSLSYSEEQKRETIILLANVQKCVARDAQKYLPGLKLEGGYHWSYYKYPSIHEGYESVRYLSWENYKYDYAYLLGGYHDTYLDAFHWTPETDDYDFTAGLTDSLDDIGVPVLQERGAVTCDTTLPITVEKGKTYQFRLIADSLPTFAAGSPCFTVSFAGHWGRDYFFQVQAVGAPGESSGFYINGAPSPVTVATVA